MFRTFFAQNIYTHVSKNKKNGQTKFCTHQEIVTFYTRGQLVVTANACLLTAIIQQRFLVQKGHNSKSIAFTLKFFAQWWQQR